MSSFDVLFREPGMDCEKEWLFPKLLRANYVIGIVLILILACVVFLGMVWGLMTSYVRPSEFLKSLLVAIVVLPVASILLIVWLRLIYEVGILFFRMLQSERDIVNELAKLNHLQQVTNQYVCDRLAEITDKLTREV